MSGKRNRRALITGASRGFGRALAKGLAEAGWHLLINARGSAALSSTRAELARSTRVTALPGDITDVVYLHELAKVAETEGGLDLLVNNAGILGPSPQPRLVDYPPDTLEQVYRVNVIAPLMVIQAMRAALTSDGRIVNITSDAGVHAYDGWGGYGSSKAALDHLSAILAVENPQWRIWWVDPGDMRTQMHQEAFPGEDISDRLLPEASVPGILALIDDNYPSGRYLARELEPAEAV